MSDEFENSDLVPVFPMQWTALGDTGIEILVGPNNGYSIPLRYRTRNDSTTKAASPSAGTSGARKKGGAS